MSKTSIPWSQISVNPISYTNMFLEAVEYETVKGSTVIVVSWQKNMGFNGIYWDAMGFNGI